MQFINYVLVAIASYLGLIVGLSLSLIAPEEIKPGKKFFFYVKRIIYVLLCLSFLYFVQKNYLIILFLIIMIFFYFIIDKSYVQILLAFLFFYSFNDLTFFLTTSSLIFLFNIAFVGFFAKEFTRKNKITNTKKLIKKVLINNLYFFICLPLFTIWFLII